MEQQHQQPRSISASGNTQVAPVVAVGGIGGQTDEAAAAASSAHVRTDSTEIAAATSTTTVTAPTNQQQPSPSSNNKRARRSYPKTRCTSFVKLSSEQILEAKVPYRKLPNYVKESETPELREAHKALRVAIKLETKRKATLDLDRQEYEEFKKLYEQVKNKFEQSQQEHNEAVELVKTATLKVQEAELAKPCNWRDMYHKLLAFHAQHGHSNVPRKRKRTWTESDEETAAADREHASFRNWLLRQKAVYRSHFAEQNGGEDGGKDNENGGKDVDGDDDDSDHDDEEDTNTTPKKKRKSRKWNGHTPHRLAALEKLGVFVGMWDQRYKELEAYKQIHGDCNVPTRSNNPALKDLGQWVGTQRTEYKKLKDGKKSQIAPERINRLEAIGFCWNVFEAKGIQRNRKY